ncbi:hypothetical protein DBR43_11400 [Pedobacter sp. KBW06]|uniref:hypothetical protein n=1 Tax=Pedobacter sp. KBW06 TaxID=2153359 RepID=UPI000F5B618B|nr:hypothetical protein [Pedobacter sp. KBW06]RQO71836.1 hypothetical protein DBR43_11400 [Pedobacter sp. KBW06]
MKSRTFFVFFGKKTSFALLLLAVAVVSCKKEEPIKAEVTKETSSKIVNTVSDSLMIKFISISQGVRKEDITYDKATNEFVVYGINRTDRVFLEAFYKDANIYHMKYGD